MKKRTVLYAEEGYVLTNGEIHGKVLFLSDGEKTSDFYEITEEEYEVIMATMSEADLTETKEENNL